MIARILLFVAAFALCACAVTRVTPKPNWLAAHGGDATGQYILPGYQPDFLESVGSLTSDSDMAPPGEFLQDACGVPGQTFVNGDGSPQSESHLNGDNADDLLHEQSAIWALSVGSGGGNQAGGQNSASGSANSSGQGGNTGGGNTAGGGGNSGGISVSLVSRLKTGTVSSSSSTPPATADGKQLYTKDSTVQNPSAANGYGYVALTSAKGSTTTTTNEPSGQLGITKCSLRVIDAAINICIERSSNRSAFNEFEGVSLGSALALGGIASGIASLAHAQTGEAALIGGSAATADVLFSGLQKVALPSAGQSQVSAIESAGLQYLALDEFLTRPAADNDKAGSDDGFPRLDGTGEDQTGNLGNLADYENHYAHLFDAAMSSCTVASQ